jgi:hypothetical protein
MCKKFLILLHLLLVLACSQAWAWNATRTHSDLSGWATIHSILSPTKGDYLRNLGLSKNLKEEFSFDGNRRNVLEWVQHGSVMEDAGDPVTAVYYNHFHNPLREWSKAGLSTGYPFISGESSLLWAQDMTTKKNDWSWPKVRDYYYLALTFSSATQREEHFAKTFKGLGHLIHLIQDAAQPAHVRDDPHPADDFGAVPQFEHWAKINQAIVSSLDRTSSLAANPIFPAVSPYSAPRGYVPITPFWDTDRYDGTKATIPLGNDFGLTEFTQANFISEDTGFASGVPYPSLGATELWADPTNNRLYLRKLSEGIPVHHLAVVGWLYSYFLRYFPDKVWLALGLDEFCYAEYATHLIPRAAGYSTALIDYFFRGKLAVTRVQGGVQVKNLSEEPLGPGLISLYYDDAGGNRKPLASYSLGYVLQPQEQTGTLNFSIPSDNGRIGRYILVYRGQLGAEADAVIGKVLVARVLYGYWDGVSRLIWSMDLDGSRPRIEIPDDRPGMLYYGPRVSPDGQGISFVSGSETGAPALWLVRPNSREFRKLADLSGDAYGHSWSPDSRFIVFASGPPENTQIWTIEVETGRQRPLTQDAYDNHQPRWSPDGTRIAYISRRVETRVECSYTQAYLKGLPVAQLVVMTPDSRELGVLSGCLDSADPVWSPDSLHLVYTEFPWMDLVMVSRSGGESIPFHLRPPLGYPYSYVHLVVPRAWILEANAILTFSAFLRWDGLLVSDIWTVSPYGDGYLRNLTNTDSSPFLTPFGRSSVGYLAD